MPDIQEKLERIAELSAVVRQRAMVYQCEDKERAARFFRRPFDTFYDLPYKRWARVRAWYVRRETQAIRAFYARDTTGGRPCDCPIFREAMGY